MSGDATWPSLKTSLSTPGMTPAESTANGSNSSVSLESTGDSSWSSAFVSGDATWPSLKTSLSTPGMTPAERSNSAMDISQAPAGSSNESRARSVATHRRRVMPKSASASLSSSTATPSHSPASSARDSSSRHASISTAGRSPSTAPRDPEASRAVRKTSGSSKLAAVDAAGAPSPSSARKRFCMAMMPIPPKAAETAAASKAGNETSPRSHSTGASVMIVAILREMSASSMCARRLSPILPLTSSACAMTSSRLPYCTINALAFLGPMILREMSASSMCARRLSPILPLTSSACAMTSSRLPYCTINALAFLGPMPGTPGMLSEESPLSP